ncbi:type I-E CRISPR-associated protein Cas5/CasD [Priestia megaterium]|uniref:type I-E CRISPR-associated protein Cas5/CasD n=1 Tax=Priestia megaterium TaxID=1404 RepID=UPI0022858699|nr:type I-E CRISPR-associated protein Cas5/CasD [Priestia megaterium]
MSSAGSSLQARNTRTDSLEDLLMLRFGVRVDAPGEIMRDFQTARQVDRKALPLTYRYYLSDATFVAGLEGPEELLTALDGHLRSPEFPLYLGRRSCPPSRPVALGVSDM